MRVRGVAIPTDCQVVGPAQRGMQEPQADDLGLCPCEPARGGGLEPPMTGPEPVVLPITPPPKGGVHPSSSRLRPGSALAQAFPHPVHPAVESDQAAKPDD